MNRPPDFGETLVKFGKVVQSCTNVRQLHTARKYADQFISQCYDHFRHEKGFEGMRFGIVLEGQVRSTISAKLHELSGGAV